MQHAIDSFTSRATKSAALLARSEALATVPAQFLARELAGLYGILHAMSLLSVWLASLVGSAHCVGMCGGWLAALELSRQSLWVYHGARIVTYVALGALAAMFGKALNGFGNATAWVAIAWILLQAWFQVVGEFKFGKFGRWTARWTSTIQNRLKTLAAHRAHPFRQAFWLGTATGFLPCGWLYSFIAVAAVAPHPALGAAIMLVFGLGTLPALAVFSAFFRQGMRWLEIRFPAFRAQWVSAALLLGAAAWIGFQNARPHVHSEHSEHSEHSSHDHP